MGWPERWDLLMRYRLIEIVALWEGRLTTNHLRQAFGIGRQQASKDINAYISNVAPENLFYDKNLKGYTPTEAFTPKVTTGIADEYLHILSRNKDISHTFERLDLGFTDTEILQPPLRTIQPEILRSLVRAIRAKERVEISYTSMKTPDGEHRVIAPHTLVCTPLRWHVRAYCEKNTDYRDFVLSRFVDEAESIGTSPNTVEGDELWNTEVIVKLRSDPRLAPAQQRFVERDYGITGDELEITTRATLVQYLLQALNLDPNKMEVDPKAQQIIIANLDEIKPYLF